MSQFELKFTVSMQHTYTCVHASCILCRHWRVTLWPHTMLQKYHLTKWKTEIPHDKVKNWLRSVFPCESLSVPWLLLPFRLMCACSNAIVAVCMLDDCAYDNMIVNLCTGYCMSRWLLSFDAKGDRGKGRLQLHQCQLHQCFYVSLHNYPCMHKSQKVHCCPRYIWLNS